MDANVAAKKEEEIFKLRDEVEELTDKKNDHLKNVRQLEQERNHFRDERNRLNQIAADAFKQVRELKERRDETNKEISELKDTRQSVLDEMRLMIQRAQKLRENIGSEQGEVKKSKVPKRKLERSIDDLDWKLQTTTMKIDEERDLVERLNSLIGELDTIKGSEKLHTELKTLNLDIKNLKGFLDDSWSRLSELVNASQSRHQRLTELYNEGKEAKEKADHSHEVFLKKSEEVRTLRDKLRAAQGELRKKYHILKEKQMERKVKTRRVREERQSYRIAIESKRIHDKYQKGEKLSLEEMRILMDQNILSLSEEEE